MLRRMPQMQVLRSPRPSALSSLSPVLIEPCPQDRECPEDRLSPPRGGESVYMHSPVLLCHACGEASVVPRDGHVVGHGHHCLSAVKYDGILDVKALDLPRVALGEPCVWVLNLLASKTSEARCNHHIFVIPHVILYILDRTTVQIPH